ncbi:MAG: DUF5343 domain-containing protein [Erythrobacter sp.]|jgi:hypothetical protein|uniref:DUF5343 domain-containing protein n=1 Tax=Qipengyuania citrea TaxID=225971 RepID=UPI001A45D797|nr:DUF5343 domain-containing protein [Qipengyuania citrea]MBL4717859.1 DUF5343 domain-containing protein [Erythrobacter sp.]MCP2018530.1 hypothetical protein [Qipengyuania citrea]MDE0902388.1 DUF5343 domain-containing protein [Erythrobacter sp.]
MEKLPPFINSTGLVTKIFDKIQEAKEPDDRYTQNFQAAVLGYGSGNAKAFIPFLKRMGFLESDGRPTQLYRQFRNPDAAAAAMAEAMRVGYSDVFARNEYAHDLSDEKFRNLLVEMTGKDKNASSINKIVATWKACKSYADFDANLTDTSASDVSDNSETMTDSPTTGVRPRLPSEFTEIPKSVGMSFGYNINLNLPATTDAKVYNAIFSALQQTLLKD